MSSTEQPARPEGEPRVARRQRAWVNVLVGGFVAALLLLMLEGSASVLLAVRAALHAMPMREESHSRYDPDLGWSHRPNLRLSNPYGEGGQFSTNAQGMRGLESFDAAVPQGRYRVIAVGDSFTMGYGVTDAAAYPSQLQALCPALQAVNMGQGGYGVDQAYLWYKRDGARLEADLLLFAVIAHDFFRMDSDNFLGYAKPVLRVRGGALAVENVPVPGGWGLRTPLRRARAFAESLGITRLGRWVAGRHAPSPGEVFYGVVSDQALAAAELAFDDLARLSKAKGQELVLVYLPIAGLLAQEPTREARWLAEYSRRAGVAFIDLAPEFQPLDTVQRARLFRRDHHYSEEGNRFVAQALLRELAGRVSGFPQCGPAAR